MSIISNNSFRSVVVGTDPVSKGTFNIVYAFMIYNYDDDLKMDSRAKGEIRIIGLDNPLYKLGKENPLRLQGLISSVMFGIEKRFIKFVSTSNYMLCEDGIVNEIELDVVFDILDNLEYVENINQYKDDNSL